MMVAAGAILIGIDIGTTNVKAVAIRPDARVVGVSRRAMRILRGPDGASDFDLDGLDRDLPVMIREVVAAASASLGTRPEVRGIAVASIGESFVGLDADGARRTGCPTWFDRRTGNLRASWGLSVKDWFDITGMVDDDIYTAHRLPWLRDNQPAIYAGVRHWLMVADYVVFRLCGETVASPSLAARSGLADRRTGAWSRTILGHVGIDPQSLPSLLPSGSGAGGLTRDMAAETGLAAGTPVVNAGHDHPCAGLACGLHGPGPVIDSTGTSEAIKTVVQRPLSFEDVGGGEYDCYPHVVPGCFLLSGHIPSSGGLIDWLLRLLSGPTPAPDTAALLWRMAEHSPPGARGVRVAPFLEGTGAPANDRGRRADISRIGAANDAGDVLRAGLEALAGWVKVNLDKVERHAGTRPEAIVLTGGGARNELANRIKASFLDRPFVMPDIAEAAGSGAALVAGMAAGLVDPAAPPSPLHAQGLARVEPVPEWVEAYARLAPDIVGHLRVGGAHADA